MADDPDHPLRRALIVGDVATDESPAEVVTVGVEAFPRMQLRDRFGSILLGSDATDLTGARSRLLAHNCAVHLVPGGSLAVSVTGEEFAADLLSCGFTQVGGTGARTFWRRTDRRTIHDVTADARGRLERLAPDELAAAIRNGDAVVVDLRVPGDRRTHGVIPGAVSIPRSVLEWRADPTSGYSHPALGSFDLRIVTVCNEGYSSSIAAASLLDLGYARATDLIGGMVGWTSAGYPVDPAPDDHELFEGPVEDLES